MAIDERELDDADLVVAAQEGDTEAFAELFRRHYGAVRRICARRLGNLADADEVAQAAFVRAFERIHQCEGERRFGAWVQVIAYRLGADARRSQARALPSDEPVTGDAALGPNSCEDALLRAERVAEVRSMLSTLPARQREVIIARDLEGRRPGEIAASLGLSLGAVDSLLLRARRRMASAWQAASVEHGAASVQVTTASLAATAAARPQAVTRVLAAIGNAVDRASLHMANALGLTPGGPAAAHMLGRLAATGAVLAGPAIGLSTLRTPSAIPHRAPAGTHSALLGLSTPPAPSVPSAPRPTTPGAPSLSPGVPSLPAVDLPPLSAPTGVSAPLLSSVDAPAGSPLTGVVGNVGTSLGAAATQAVNQAVNQAVTGVAQAVSSVSPSSAPAVQATGATVGAAVASSTQSVSATLSSLLPKK
jgi:RNA polymerase sigma-70 factor (ECF subfamily)